MKVSLNTVKQYIDVDLPAVDELVARINSQLGGVEEVIDLGAKYKGAIIIKVVECDKHPNADKLSLCQIDAGTGELVQVVCGAPNVHADMWAVWLPPESTVPSTFDDAEPFVLPARELRGKMSNGMLASAKELALGDDHNGIVEITDRDLPEGQAPLQPGQSFAEVFGLNDTIIDIENKMFTHRPDLFGQLGVAREIAGILGHKFTSPEWYLRLLEFENGSGLELEVFNDADEKVPRMMFVAMKDVEIKPSPLWLQCALVAMGSKSINNIVDMTNYVMLLTSQPVHAYDYDKVRGRKIGARMAQKGETIKLLNDKTYELTEEDIVIADGEGPIGLGGIMGGGESEVDEVTKNIVLEIATFDMYTVRRSSMKYGLFTDALTRFNKGQSPLQNDRIMNQLMMSVEGVSSAKQASDVFDLKNENIKVIQRDKRVTLGNGTEKEKSIFSWGSVAGVIVLENTFINDRLGLELSPTEICNLLRNVEIKANEEPEPNTPNQLEVIAPYWRTDIELPEDVVEEVGRLYGFDKLPRELPQRSTKPTPVNLSIIAKQKIRDSLSRAGANEVLTYSFVHQNILERAEQDVDQAFKLSNALSPDLQYYRLSLTPSLLDKVHANIKAGHDEFALFEIGKAHNVNDMDDEGLPRQYGRVALVYANRKEIKGSAYYQARRLAMSLYAGNHLDHQVTFTKLSDFDFANMAMLEQMCAPYEPTRSAMIYIGKQFVGVVGEYKLSVAQKFKLPQSASGFELFLSPFAETRIASYAPLNRFPSTRQDVSLRVDADASYAKVFTDVERTLSEMAAGLRTSVEPVSIYQADDDTKTISLRITANNPEATLTDSDMNKLIEAIDEKLAESVGATRI